MTWVLFLDDVRHPTSRMEEIIPAGEHLYSHVVWCRDVEQAMFATKYRGCPKFMYLDHDLGPDENALTYLKALANVYDDVPEYRIISANPVGAKNIESFMESWRKSIEMD